MLKAFTRLCMLLTVLTFAAAITKADTVTITSGFLSEDLCGQDFDRGFVLLFNADDPIT